eukprot:6193456-Pleurochrysis_carterae.AAC.1
MLLHSFWACANGWSSAFQRKVLGIFAVFAVWSPRHPSSDKKIAIFALLQQRDLGSGPFLDFQQTFHEFAGIARCHFLKVGFLLLCGQDEASVENEPGAMLTPRPGSPQLKSAVADRAALPQQTGLGY